MLTSTNYKFFNWHKKHMIVVSADLLNNFRNGQSPSQKIKVKLGKSTRFYDKLTLIKNLFLLAEFCSWFTIC